VANQFILRHRGGRSLCNLDQRAVSEEPDCRLNRGFGEASLGGQALQFGDELQPGGQLNIALWSDDVEATARELKAKGVEFVMQPKRMPYGTTSILKDVDGNCRVLSSK
jgi:predicted enzyme related to lactoylglutathione lyase